MRLAVQQSPSTQGCASLPNTVSNTEQLQALVLQLMSFSIQLNQTGF